MPGHSFRPVAGAVAGATSVIVFTFVHQVTISNIWAMAPVMVGAGALSGALLVWAYARMTPEPSVWHWVGFGGVHIGMFAVLPAFSMVLYAPVITFAEAVNLNGPPGDLIVDALPMTVVVTVAVSALVTAMFGRWRDLGPVLVATTVLMLLLGLNLTVVGFVEFSGSDFRVIAEFPGLVVLLGGVFVAGVAVLDRHALR